MLKFICFTGQARFALKVTNLVRLLQFVLQFLTFQVKRFTHFQPSYFDVAFIRVLKIDASSNLLDLVKAFSSKYPELFITLAIVVGFPVVIYIVLHCWCKWFSSSIFTNKDMQKARNKRRKRRDESWVDQAKRRHELWRRCKENWVKLRNAKRSLIANIKKTICERNLSRSQLLLDGILYFIVLGTLIALYYYHGDLKTFSFFALLMILITVISPIIPISFASSDAMWIRWEQYKRYTPHQTGYMIAMISALFKVFCFACIFGVPLVFVPPIIYQSLSPMIITIAMIIFIVEWIDSPNWCSDLPQSAGLHHVIGRVWEVYHHDNRGENRAWFQALLAPWRILFQLRKRWIRLAFIHLPVLVIGSYIYYFYNPSITIWQSTFNKSHWSSTEVVTFEGNAFTKKEGDISSQLVWRCDSGLVIDPNVPKAYGRFFSISLPAGVFTVTSSVQGRFGLVAKESHTFRVIDRPESQKGVKIISPNNNESFPSEAIVSFEAVLSGDSSDNATLYWDFFPIEKQMKIPVDASGNYLGYGPKISKQFSDGTYLICVYFYSGDDILTDFITISVGNRANGI